MQQRRGLYTVSLLIIILLNNVQLLWEMAVSRTASSLATAGSKCRGPSGRTMERLISSSVVAVGCSEFMN